MRRSTPGLQIGDLDQNLFSYLYENRSATCAQIHRDIYPTYTRRSVQQRLCKLIRHRFVRRSFASGLGNTMAYSAYPKCIDKAAWAAEKKLSQRLGSYATAHDIALVDIRRRMCQLPAVKSYTPEKLISYDRDSSMFAFWVKHLRPDALVDIEINGKSFQLTLEYEASLKYAERYARLFRDYYTAEDITAVFYICKDANLLQRVRNFDKKEVGSRCPKFYYSDFSTWKEDATPEFISLKGSRINLSL